MLRCNVHPLANLLRVGGWVVVVRSNLRQKESASGCSVIGGTFWWYALLVVGCGSTCASSRFFCSMIVEASSGVLAPGSGGSMNVPVNYSLLACETAGHWAVVSRNHLAHTDKLGCQPLGVMKIFIIDQKKNQSWCGCKRYRRIGRLN